jgi:uncharacterized integral membrane protein
MKTIFLVTITVLVTIILMKNTDEVNFWIFGDTRVPKLAILGIMFGLGFVVGIVIARPSKKKIFEEPEVRKDYPDEGSDYLSDEDREYIS